MKLKIFLPMLLMLILSALAVTAWDETYTLNYEYSEGDWNDTYTAEMAADYDYTDFGSCDGFCTLIVNVTTNASYIHYDSAIWGINFTNVINGEDASTHADCWDNNFITFVVQINSSDLDNVYLGCEDQTNPDSYLPLDDDYNATSGGGNISGMYLYINDITPTVTLDDGINGSTKPCTEDFTRESDIIFEADDPTDTEMTCCVIVNDVEDASSCNSSIQDETTSVLHTDALEEGDNTVYVRCYDETRYGDSNAMTLRGEACADCAINFMPDIIKLAILVALLIFFAVNAFGKVLDFKNTWWYFAAFVAIMFIIWWIQNWQNVC